MAVPPGGVTPGAPPAARLPGAAGFGGRTTEGSSSFAVNRFCNDSKARCVSLSVASSLAKITNCGAVCEERKGSEDRGENNSVTSGKLLHHSGHFTCHDESSVESVCITAGKAVPLQQEQCCPQRALGSPSLPFALQKDEFRLAARFQFPDGRESARRTRPRPSPQEN